MPTRSSTSPACGLRTGFAHLFFAERNQFHIVHNDELVQMGQQLLKLICGNLQLELGFAGEWGSQQRVATDGRRGGGAAPLRRSFLSAAPHREIALDVTLRIEQQVPRAGVGKEIVDGVGDHSAEPAKSIRSANGHAAHPAEIVDRRPGCQRRRFRFRRVQLCGGQYAAVNS